MVGTITTAAHPLQAEKCHLQPPRGGLLAPEEQQRKSILKAQDLIDLVVWRGRLSKVYGFGTIG